MGRFGALDGMIMLLLQLALVSAGVLAGSRLAASGKGGAVGGEQVAPKLWRVLSCALLSFVFAFVVHIAVLNGLKHGWTAAYANLVLKRLIVALAWGGASGLALWLSLRPRLRAALWLGGLGGALAYLIFAFWRA